MCAKFNIKKSSQITSEKIHKCGGLQSANIPLYFGLNEQEKTTSKVVFVIIF